MMKLTAALRSFVMIFVAIAVVYAGRALMAAPHAAGLCCNSNDECYADEVCCRPESVGEGSNCSSQAPNYCRTLCIPSGL